MPAEVISMAYREQFGLPWHRLGTPVTERVTATRLFELAGGLYQVAKAPLTATLPDGTLITSPSCDIYSNHSGEWTYLNTVKRPDNYEIVQNADIAAVLDAGDDTRPSLSKVFEMDTAGVLSDGKRSFICFRMGRDTVKIGVDGNDDYETHGFVYNSYATGEEKVLWGLATTRIVCLNTAMMAVGESEEDGTLWTFSHRSDPMMWLRYRAELERVLQAQRKSFYADLQRMLDVNWAVDERAEFVNSLFPFPAVPKDVKRASTVTDDIREDLRVPVLAAGQKAQDRFEAGVTLAEENRAGVLGRIAEYEEQFGQTLYAGYQGATDWLCWSKQRGDWNDMAENVMFNTRFRDTQRLIKISRGILNRN